MRIESKIERLERKLNFTPKIKLMIKKQKEIIEKYRMKGAKKSNYEL